MKLSIACLNFLSIKYKVDDFKNSKLFGRLSQVDKNILVDVGHNPLAAASIVEVLKDKKYILIYNTYKDKEYKKILQILKPIIWHVEIIDIDEQRIETYEALKRTLTDLEIEYRLFNRCDKDNKYLVFGSFSVVEAFLGRYNE